VITDHVFRYNPDRKPTTTGVRTGITPNGCVYLGTCNHERDDHERAVTPVRRPPAVTTTEGDAPQ
jgi:hypothetical protein